MKKTVYIIPAIAFILFVAAGIKIFRGGFSDGNEPGVLILHNPVLRGSHPGVLEAYEKALADEGLAHKSITPSFILSRTFEELLETNPVIIIPDSIAQVLPDDAGLWFINYLAGGGNLMVVYDAGIKNRQGAYLHKAMFSEFTGFNYIYYDKFRQSAYTRGYMQFKNTESAEFFGIPGEFLDAGNFLYGRSDGNLEMIESPMARLEIPGGIREEDIYMYGVTAGGEKYPAVVSARYGKGKVLYVNFPLGYLSVYVNELPLRAVLETFLSKMAEAPQPGIE